MKLDRYMKVVLTMIAAALVVIAINPWLARGTWHSVVLPGSAEAQGAKYEVSVPKAWGKLVAFSNNNLLLESADGMLRIVDVEGKAPEYPKVKVLIRWN